MLKFLLNAVASSWRYRVPVITVGQLQGFGRVIWN